MHNLKQLLKEIHIILLFINKNKINLIDNTLKINNKIIKIENIGNGTTSQIFKDLNNTFIIKKIIEYKNYNIFEREIFILKLLNNKNINVPKLLWYDYINQIIIMTYCGTSLTEEIFESNKNYKEQLSNIIKELKKLNIKHNDIKYNAEILLLNNTIYLCDFGWATLNDLWNCDINISNKKKPCIITNDDIFL
jgi:tRNA A-37 threonylcarbamoyl transferase component Bud32